MLLLKMAHILFPLHSSIIFLHYLRQSANAGVIFRFRACRNQVFSCRSCETMFGAHADRKFLEGCSKESGKGENLRAQDQVNKMGVE